MTSREASKTCTKCKRVLPYSDFAKRPQKRDGHRSECRECGREAQRESAKKSRQKNRWHYSVLKGRWKANDEDLPCEMFTADEMVEYWKAVGIDPERSYYTNKLLGDVHNLDHKIPFHHADSPGHVLSNVVPSLPGENKTKGVEHPVTALAAIHEKEEVPVKPLNDVVFHLSSKWGERDENQ